MTDVKVEIRGVAELARAFKQVDAELPKEMKAAFRAIVEKVIGLARSRMEFGPGRAASSLRPRSTAKGAGIAFGGNSAPHYPWLDFGGSVGRGHQAGRPWSGAIKREWRGVPSGSGRYLYPAITDLRDLIIREVNEAVERTAQHAGFEVRGTD